MKTALAIKITEKEYGYDFVIKIYDGYQVAGKVGADHTDLAKFELEQRLKHLMVAAGATRQDYATFPKHGDHYLRMRETRADFRIWYHTGAAEVAFSVARRIAVLLETIPNSKNL